MAFRCRALATRSFFVIAAHSSLVAFRGIGGSSLAGKDLAGRKPCSRTHWIMRYVRRSEEHTSELQSLMRISYAVFCLKKKKHKVLLQHNTQTQHTN